MRTLALLTLLSLYYQPPLFSQQWVWDTAATFHQGNRLAKDNFGHIYSFNYNDTALTKMTINGVIIWQKSFPSNLELRSVCCSPDSSVYLMGRFSDNLVIGGNSLSSMGKTDL